MLIKLYMFRSEYLYRLIRDKIRCRQLTGRGEGMKINLLKNCGIDNCIYNVNDNINIHLKKKLISINMPAIVDAAR